MGGRRDCHRRVAKGRSGRLLGGDCRGEEGGREGKGIGELLSEVGSWPSGGSTEAGGSGDDAADSTYPGSEGDDVEGAVDETEPATETETAPGARSGSTQRAGSCEGRADFGLVSHVQSKVTWLPYAHIGKYLRQHLHEQERSAANRVYVCFTGTRENLDGVRGKPRTHAFRHYGDGHLA